MKAKSKYRITALCTKGEAELLSFECEAYTSEQAKGFWLTTEVARRYKCFSNGQIDWRKLNTIKSYYLRDIQVNPK